MNAALTLITGALLAPLALRAAEPLTNSIGIRLVPIEAGSFVMGQDGPPLEDYMGQKRLGEMYKDSDRIDFDEKPSHKVTITRPFLMGVTEVTVAQYRQFDIGFKTSAATSKPADDDAASGISWHKAVEFCDWLSKRAEGGAESHGRIEVWRTRRRFMDSRERQTGCGGFFARGAKDAKRLGPSRHAGQPGRVVLRLVWAV